MGHTQNVRNISLSEGATVGLLSEVEGRTCSPRTAKKYPKWASMRRGYRRRSGLDALEATAYLVSHCDVVITKKFSRYKKIPNIEISMISVVWACGYIFGVLTLPHAQFDLGFSKRQRQINCQHINNVINKTYLIN